MNESIGIIGGGSWGTAIAHLLANNLHNVLIYLRDKDLIEDINNKHINSKYFPKNNLSKLIKSTDDIREILEFSKNIIISVPTDATRTIMNKISKYIKQEHIFVSTAKGIEEKTYLRNSQIINEFCDNPVAVLSGPTHAEEVINDLPSAAVIAAEDKNTAKFVQDLFMSSYFRVYTNPDLTGVELGGAVKNIIALASGIADGLKYGDNTRAALITRGLAEMSRFGAYLKGNIITFSGLAGMGALVVTCTSMHSRNRRFGIKIGQGLSMDEAINEINQVVEGIKTTKAIYDWKKKKNLIVELPITCEVYKVLFENKTPENAVHELMLRGAKNEMNI